MAQTKIHVDAGIIGSIEFLLDHLAWINLYAILPDDAADAGLVDQAIEHVRTWLDRTHPDTCQPQT